MYSATVIFSRTTFLASPGWYSHWLPSSHTSLTPSPNNSRNTHSAFFNVQLIGILILEMIHSTGTPKRLNRQTGSKFGDTWSCFWFTLVFFRFFILFVVISILMCIFASMKPHTFILALGTNAGGEEIIRQAYGLLCERLGALRLSRIMKTEPEGMVSPPFHNALAMGRCTLSADELRAVLKHTEQLCGDTRELRAQNVITLDIDLLQLGSRRYKPADWQRSYVRQLYEEMDSQPVVDRLAKEKE